MTAIRKDVAKPKVCSKAQFNAVLTLIISGLATHKALTETKVKPAEFYARLAVDDESGLKYARAKTASLDRLADEIVEIGDEAPPMVSSQFDDHVDAGHVAWSKSRRDDRKWLLAKLAPRKWGDKVQQEVSGVDGAPIEVRQVGPILADLRGALSLPVTIDGIASDGD